MPTVKKIGKPILLNHYYELGGSNGETFDIYYLEDRNPDIRVQRIDMPDALSYHLRQYDRSPKQTYQHHILYHVMFQLQPSDTMDTYGEDMETTLLHVYYSDGTRETVPFGRLFIEGNGKQTPKNDDSNESIVNWYSTGGSSNYSGFTQAKAEMPFKLTGTDSIQAGRLGSWLELKLLMPDGSDVRSPSEELLSGEKIRGIPLPQVDYPLDVAQDDILQLNYQFRFPDKNKPLEALTPMVFPVRFQADSGSFKTRVQYRPNFNEADIRRLIQLRGENG